MADIHSSDSENSYCADKLMEVLFTKLVPIEGDKTVHDLLQVIYRLKPECFQPIGGIHNSEDGKETYQSVKIWVARSYYLTMHVYGIMRGAFLKVNHIEVKQKDKIYKIVFSRPDAVGGSRRFGEDKCPW